MYLTRPTSPNNISQLTSDQFASIVQGEDDTWLHPNGSNMRESFRQTNRNLEKLGLPLNPFTIFIPRYLDYTLRMSYDSMPSNRRPDISQLRMHEVIGSVNIYRGVHTFEARPAKEPLKHNINISYCRIEGDFNINHVVSSEYLKLYCCTISQKEYPANNNKGHAILIKDSQFRSIKIDLLAGHLEEEIVELRELTIEDVKTEELEIVWCKVGEIRIINKGNSIGKVAIKGGDIRKLTLEGTFKECIIEGVNVVACIDIKAQYEQIIVKGKVEDAVAGDNSKEAYITSLAVNAYNQTNKGSLVISQANIGTLKLSGVHNGNITIRHTTTATCCFSDFTNSGEIRLHNVRIEKYFLIRETVLGKTDFTSVYMDRAKAELTLSNISEITLINTKFPDGISSFISDDYDLRGVQEAYRQLKMAANKQSNKIDELRYEALEMDAYKADNSQKKSLSEKVILYTNAWSNKHGQDWFLALLWLGLTTRASYLLIKFLLGFNIKFHLPHVDDFITYLEFAFNPLHEFKGIFGENNISPNVPWARLIDLISKSLAAYLLFQLVKAFRKYVKEA